ncbi:hypothetical protein EDB81DRAFT_769579 [Dactylonectria macrodidyma]|uniref:Uncharacterized protein n=1 Tax=Dactylonectria macrodidyma TaxID=307937 RepID=A0A9P9FSA4_9HYPO|nr:hypothetical protein EDB81DRAFT_769579 [Dactylonectria macrodidyma]
MFFAKLVALSLVSLVAAQNSQSIIYSERNFQGATRPIPADDICVTLEDPFIHHINSLELGFRVHCQFYYDPNCKSWKDDHTYGTSRISSSPEVLSVRCGPRFLKQPRRTRKLKKSSRRTNLDWE